MGIVVKPKTRRRYSAEFKRETLALVDQGMAPAQVARQQGIREANIYRWRRELETPAAAELERAYAEIAQLKDENARLRAALERQKVP